jgi:phage/plasmid-associated DNA primase
MYMNLFKMGYITIPCVGKNPAPGVSGWNNWCVDGIPESEIERFEKHYPVGKFNIGMVAGPASNNTVWADLDTVDEYLQEITQRSPLERIGARGWGGVFKNPGHINNCEETRQNKNLDKDLTGKLEEGLEIRARGLYMIIPPSIHVQTGKPYTWIGESVENFNPEYIPFLTDDYLNVFDAIRGGETGLVRSSSLGTILNNNDPSRKSPSGSHNACKSKAMWLISQGMPILAGVKELLKYDDFHHRPCGYFSDRTRSECKADPFTNALKFYANNLHSINRERIRRGEIPNSFSELVININEEKLSKIESIKVVPPAWGVDEKTGKKIPPKQEEVAEALFSAYKYHLIREVQDVFIYNGKYWEELNPFDFKRAIRKIAQVSVNGFAKDRELDAYYNILIDKLNTVPQFVSMYKQNPTLANFLDGTLEVSSDYKISFREHRKDDYLTSCLPYEYKSPREYNQIFRDWLMRAFENDPDANGKVRAIKQIGGACIVSMFPRTVFLFGDAGTGKSTFAKLFATFVGDENMAGVQPSLMQQGSFMMESLINKRVNVITDISEARIDPAIFKQIEDRMPFQVNRKGRKAIMANIPSLHIFCGNVLPRGIDGASDAMDRRVSIIEFNKNVGTDTSSHVRDYERVILNAGSGDVLQFFLEGLEDLCDSGGIYFNPESGKEKLKEWKTDNDALSAFFEAIRDGDVPRLYLRDGALIRAGDLFTRFQSWKSDLRLWSTIGKKSFNRAVRKNGFEVTVDPHNRVYVKGIAIEIL